MSKWFKAIGLMSGTSMDGIDVALLETDGADGVRRIGGRSYAYDEAFRARLRAGLGDALGMVARDERPGELAALESDLTERHAAAVSRFCEDSGVDLASVEVIGFHGQTVLHRPEAGLTVQLGDGRLLAEETGRPVVFDMRAADVAAGGQGAPMAPVYHRAMVGGGSEGVPAAVLNIGGVANVTFVGSGGDLLAFDTGPGNALLDDWVAAKGGGFDEDGRVSGAGTADLTVMAGLLQQNFFVEPPPKSLDRNAFTVSGLEGLSVEDGAATLAAFTVEAVGLAARWFPEPVERWIVCGGGRRNRTIMAGLNARLKAAAVTAEDVGFDGDLVEAEAWAYLAVRSRLGLALTFPGTTGVAEEMTGGVLVGA